MDGKKTYAKIPGLTLFRWSFVFLALGTSSSLVLQRDVDSAAREFLEGFGPTLGLWGLGLMFTGLLMAMTIRVERFEMYKWLLQISAFMWGIYALSFIPPIFYANAPWTAVFGYLFVASMHQVGAIVEVVVAHVQSPEYWNSL